MGAAGPRDEQVSKVLSHALRHEPWLYELELDDEGWTSLDALLAALRAEHESWRGLLRADLERVVAGGSKRRHEIAGDRIRALYGHGTSPAAAPVILGQGLLPMSRQYVHLSVDTAMAREVGRRKAKAPLLLEIDAPRAHAAGVTFYAGNEKVWLADVVPAAFLRLLP